MMSPLMLKKWDMPEDEFDADGYAWRTSLMPLKAMIWPEDEV